MLDSTMYFLFGAGLAWALIKASKGEKRLDEHEYYVIEAIETRPDEASGRAEEAKEKFRSDSKIFAPSPEQLKKSPYGSAYLRYRKIQDLHGRLIKAGWKPPQ